jgi:uncharacterized membrane protein (UPF0127 family)
MWRRNLDWGKGMLFWNDGDVRDAYWMKNTIVPLTVAFIHSDGVILEMHDMEPLDLTLRGTSTYRWALEVPRGFMRRVGIKIGDGVSICTRDLE